MKVSWVIFGSALISGCGILSSSNSGQDPQFIQIFYHSGALDELDTFHGTYQKDLIPGIATTTMWLTTREQEIILTKLDQIGFFAFPDSLLNKLLTVFATKPAIFWLLLQPIEVRGLAQWRSLELLPNRRNL